MVSAGFKLWKPDPFQDLQSTQRYVSGDVYAHTKLLNVLASLALARRLPAEQVTVNLIHPGMAWTQMTQSMTSQTIPAFRLAWPLLRAVQRRRSPEKAGRQVAVVASAAQLDGSLRHSRQRVTLASVRCEWLGCRMGELAAIHEGAGPAR